MAIGLGMKVQGYDPALSVEAAWRLPSKVQTQREYCRPGCQLGLSSSLHLPVLDSTRGLINARSFRRDAQKATCLLNFARDEIVDSKALLAALEESGKTRQVRQRFPPP